MQATNTCWTNHGRWPETIMGCRIIIGREQGTENEVAVLFDSVTMTAFGPVFRPAALAEVYLNWELSRGVDPRSARYSEMEQRLKMFRQAIADLTRIVEDAHRPQITVGDHYLCAELAEGVQVYLLPIGEHQYADKITMPLHGGTITIEADAAADCGFNFSNVEALVKDLRDEWQRTPT